MGLVCASVWLFGLTTSEYAKNLLAVWITEWIQVV
jgi:hypothetical protein